MADMEKVIKETEDGIAFAESRGFGGLANTMRDALAMLKEQKEIIQCKNCKYHDEEDGINFCDCGNRPDDWYCAGGERKEGR